MILKASSNDRRIVGHLCLLLGYVISMAQGDQCANALGPVVVPIQNVSLAGGGLRRGVYLSIGTPPTALAFNPVGYLNNTVFMVIPDSCPDPDAALYNSPDSCITLEGGDFDTGASSSYIESDDGNNVGGAEESSNATYKGSAWAADTLHLNDNLALDRFPLALGSGGLQSHSIGLGMNSTLIDHLHSVGAIASKTWSIFYGLVGAEQYSQMNGSLIFEGYDAAKTDGPNYTSDLYLASGVPQPLCDSGLLVAAKDIVMNFRNGTSHSIAEGDSGRQFCIQPDYDPISLPQTMWDDFQAWAGGQRLSSSGGGLAGTAQVYSAEGVYSGDLTISLVSGLNITIPNNQLVTVDQYIDAKHGEIMFNDSTRAIMLANQTNGSDLPVLGKTFLTSAYLMVDQEKQNFTLWKAKPTLQQDLKRIDAANCTADGPSSSASSAPSIPSLRPAPPPSGNRSRAGVIAGPIVGGLVAVALIIGAVVYLRRRGGSKEEHDDPSDGYGIPEEQGNSYGIQAEQVQPLKVYQGGESSELSNREVSLEHKL